jgi:hypothetical protein
MLSASAWGRLRFSQTFPLLVGTLALLLLAKAPGKLAGTPSGASGGEGSPESPGAPPGDPSGGASSEAPGDGTGPARPSLTIEPPSRSGAHGVRAEKGGGGAAIVTEHRDPVLVHSRCMPDALGTGHAPSRPASPFAARAPPSPRNLVV